MVKDNTFIIMGINIKANGRTGKNMVKAHTLMPVALSMKENSATGLWMVRAYSLGTMGQKE